MASHKSISHRRTEIQLPNVVPALRRSHPVHGANTNSCALRRKERRRICRTGGLPFCLEKQTAFPTFDPIVADPDKHGRFLQLDGTTTSIP